MNVNILDILNMILQHKLPGILASCVYCDGIRLKKV